MSLHPDIIAALVAAGGTSDMIIAVCRAAHEVELKAKMERRAPAAARQKRRRGRDLVDDMQEPQDEQKFIDAALKNESMSHESQESRVTECDKRNLHKENTSLLPSEATEVNYATPPRAREPEPLISEEAREMAEAIGREAGFDPIDTPPGWCGAANYLQAFLNSGLSAEHVRVACTTVLRRRHAALRGPPEEFSYFRKPVAEICADLSREAPKVESRALEIIDGGKSNAGARAWRADGRSRNHGSATDAASDLRQYFARRAEAEQREAAGNDCDKGGIADGRVPP